MPTPAPPPRRDTEPTGIGAALAGFGVLAAMVLCCAGPALIAAGALAGIGAVLSNPWVIAAAVVLPAATVTLVVRRRRRGRAGCCPPTATGPRAPEDRDRVSGPADQEGRYRR